MSRALAPEDIGALTVPADPRLAPDGSVVFTVRRADLDTDRTVSALWRLPASGDPVPLTDGPQDSSPAVSPDGATVAFLRQAEPGEPAQLWSVPIGGGRAVPLTEPDRLPQGAGAPVWSPDGHRIAFSAPVPRDGRPRRPDPDDPLVADRLAFKADGSGRWGETVHHLFVLDVLGDGLPGLLRQVTGADRRGDWHAGTPAFSPDGTRLAFTAAAEPDADVDLTSCAYVVDVSGASTGSAGASTGSASGGAGASTGSASASTGSAGGAAGIVRVGRARNVSGPVVWSADGSAVLAIGRDDATIGNAHLLRLDVAGDQPDRSLSVALDRNVMPGSAAYPGAAPVLTADGDVLFCVRERGWTHLWRVPADGSGEPRPVVTGEHTSVTGLGAHPALPDRIAVVLTDQHRFGEIALVDPDDGSAEVRTTLTATSLPEVELVAGEPRSFDVAGTEVNGWLFRPAGADGPTPLLLDVHGGPHNAWTGLADPTHVYQQQLLDRGWSVLIVNPRGSDGYGEQFLTAVVGRWGEADEADFLTPIDTLVAEGLVDPDRIAITGYSYGGFTTCRLTARTDRFAAAVAGGVICDLTASVGASDLGLALTVAFELADPIADHDRLWVQSPLREVGAVRTPTLVLHGEADHRCPVNQAERWFGLLRLQRVPTELVVYPGGAHGFVVDGRPSHRVDYNRRVVDWIERYVPS